VGLHSVEKKADEGLLGEGIPLPFASHMTQLSFARAHKNECSDDVIICGLFSLGSSYHLQPSQFGLLV
jgi:hypothetical protein